MMEDKTRFSGWPMLREALRSTANRRDNVSPVLYQPAKTKSDLIPGPRTQESKDWLLSGINSAMSEGGHILDVGCANGLDSALLADMGYNVVSTDLDSNMIDRCVHNRSVLVESGSSPSWEMFQSEMTTVKDTLAKHTHLPQRYDVVICFGTFMFLLDTEDVLKTLQNFADLLKPGGVLLLDFRNFQSMLERGTIVKNGANPGALHVLAGEIRCTSIDPYVLLGPNRMPLAVYLNYNMQDGSVLPLVMNPLMPDDIKAAAKQSFGEDCEVTTYHDLKVNHPDPVEAAWLAFVIKKPKTL